MSYLPWRLMLLGLATIAGAWFLAISPPPQVKAAFVQAASTILDIEDEPVLPGDDSDPRAIAIKAVLDGSYVKARLIAARAKDPDLKTLIDWLAAQQPDAIGFTNSRRNKFLADNPDWPGQSRIKNGYGAPRLPKRAKDIVEHYETYPPLKSVQWFTYLKALSDIGNEAQVSETVKRLWRSRTFLADDERRFETQYGDLLTNDDHDQRMEWLLANDHKISGERHIGRLTGENRDLYLARFALLKGDQAEATRLRSGLTEAQQKHPDFTLKTMRALIGDNMITKATELFLDVAATKPDPGSLIDMRIELARDAIYLKRYQAAYDLLADHGMPEGEKAGHADVLAGWVKLRKLGDAAGAIPHLHSALQTASGTDKSKAGLWLAKAYEAEGKTDEAEAALVLCSQQYLDLYAQICAEMADLSPVIDATPLDKNFETIAQQPMAKGARDLMAAGEARLASRLIYGLGDAANTDAERRQVLGYAWSIGLKKFSYIAADRLLAKGYDVWSASRPMLDMELRAMKSVEDKAFLFSLMYQESRFDPTTKSSAGAVGVAQLLPATAKQMATDQGIEFSEPRLILDPQYNAQLGWYYVIWSKIRFDNHPMYVLISYNAGPGRVKQWRKQLGDVVGKDAFAVLDWIEHIPFKETRTYVTKVFENVVPYKHLLTGKYEPTSVMDFISNAS